MSAKYREPLLNSIKLAPEREREREEKRGEEKHLIYYIHKCMPLTGKGKNETLKATITTN